MGKTIYINCPFCKGMMELDVANGKIVQSWEHGKETANEGDKIGAALKKLEEAKERRKDLFSKRKEELEDQKKKIIGSFEKEVERAREEGVDEKPLRPFDLD